MKVWSGFQVFLLCYLLSFIFTQQSMAGSRRIEKSKKRVQRTLQRRYPRYRLYAEGDSSSKNRQFRAVSAESKETKEQTLSFTAYFGMTQAQIQTAGLSSYGAGRTSTLSLGTEIQWAPSRYLGFSLDGFYGFKAQQTVFSTVNRSVDQFGAESNLLLKLPIDAKNASVTPVVGVGYGGLGLHYSLNSGASSLADYLGAYGPQALVGLEVKVKSLVSIYAGYSHSFSGKSIETVYLGSAAIALDSSAYSRIRICTRLFLTESTSLGLEYNRRGLSFEGTVQGSDRGPVALDLSFDQFYLSLGFRL